MIIEEMENTEFSKEADFDPDDELFIRDKIFDNQFEQTELDTTEKSFQIDSSAIEKTLDEKIDEQMIYAKIKNLLTGDPKYNRYNIQNADGTFPKLNKSDINDIYRHVLESIPGVPIIEVFSVITTIYEISPEKFYESLSNTFKTGLINELRRRGYLQKRKSLF